MAKHVRPTTRRIRESYRGITLIARTYRTSVAGKAWCDGREVGALEGASEDDVIAGLREIVDAAIIVETAPGTVAYPGAEAYEVALRRNLERFTGRQLAMLGAHYAAPDRMLSGAALTEAAGYPSWASARNQYAAVGRMLGESMMFQPAARSPGKPTWVLMVARCDGQDHGSAQSYWRMRDELAESLSMSRVLEAP